MNSTIVGSNGGAVGTVSVTSVGGGTTFGAVAPGNNSWHSGRLFTDKNAAGYVCQWSIGSYNAASRLNLRANHIAGNYQAQISRNMGLADNTTIDFNFPIPIRIPKLGLVSVRGIAKGSQNEVTTAFECYLRVE